MRDVSWIDPHKFAAAFRLAPDDLRNAFPKRYAPDPHLEACLVNESQVRICPHCAAKGYHSHFHDLLFIAECPIHRVSLLTDCPKCSRPISSEVTRAAHKDPYACPCGHVFWSSLRSPVFSPSELELMRTAIAWLDETAPALKSAIQGFSARNDRCGDPLGPIVGTAIRFLAERGRKAPVFVAGVKRAPLP